MASFGVPVSHYAVDLTIARGLDYYTGTVYETTMTDHPEIGSICSGGRYDNLAEYYADRKFPGVGISIGLTRLFFILEDKGYLNGDILTAPADILILPGRRISTGCRSGQMMGGGSGTDIQREKAQVEGRV